MSIVPDQAEKRDFRWPFHGPSGTLRLICVYSGAALVEIEGEVIATADGAVELSRSEIFAE